MLFKSVLCYYQKMCDFFSWSKKKKRSWKWSPLGNRTGENEGVGRAGVFCIILCFYIQKAFCINFFVIISLAICICYSIYKLQLIFSMKSMHTKLKHLCCPIGQAKAILTGSSSSLGVSKSWKALSPPLLVSDTLVKESVSHDPHRS